MHSSKRYSLAPVGPVELNHTKKSVFISDNMYIRVLWRGMAVVCVKMPDVLSSWSCPQSYLRMTLRGIEFLHRHWVLHR